MKYKFYYEACVEGKPIKVRESLVDMEYLPGHEPAFTAVVECRLGQGFAFEGYATKDDMDALVEDNILSGNVNTEVLGLKATPADLRYDILEQRARAMRADMHAATKKESGRNRFNS